jgi:hypothetical protein
MLHLLALLGHAYIAIITFLFLLGAVGSAVVLVMTFWEDMLTIVGRGEPDARAVRRPTAPHRAVPGQALV